jgi:arabinofuranosyltransferase
LLGALGILSGPGVHWIDRCALTDRFLAELPYARGGLRWRVGHYLRSMPEGYVEAIASADSSVVKDPAESQRLAELWLRIRQ